MIENVPVMFDGVAAPTYSELRRLASSLPRIPRREFRCAPDVYKAIKLVCQGPFSTFPEATVTYGGADVYVKDDFPAGHWEFYEDNVMVKDGTLEPCPSS